MRTKEPLRGQHGGPPPWYRPVRPPPQKGSLSLSAWLLPAWLWLCAACAFAPWEFASQHLAPRALGLLERNNLLRKPLVRLIRWRPFDWFFLAAIFANCVTLAMASSKPGFEESSLGQSLTIANYVFVALFALEALIKILALGFVFAPHTYLRNGWNCLDFIVVVMGILELTAIGNYTFIRSFRVLRPLRAITKIESLKLIVASLLRSIPMLGDVFILACFYFTVCGITCVELFRGALVYRCASPDFTLAQADSDGYLLNVSYIVDAVPADGSPTIVCKGPSPYDRMWSNASGVPSMPEFSVLGGRQWGYACPWQPTDNPNNPNYPSGQVCVAWGNPDTGGYRNFDNILLAWIMVLQHMATQDWSLIMYNTQEAASWWTWLLHVPMVLMGAFLLVNLTIAVIYISFNRHFSAAVTNVGSNDNTSFHNSAVLFPLGKDTPAEQDLTSPRGLGHRAHDSQQQLLHHLPEPDPILSDALEEKEERPWSRTRLLWEQFRDTCYLVQASAVFQHFTTAMIICNAIVLALVWNEMPESVARGTECANYYFTCYFLVEMLIKITGLGPRRYCADRFNIFDGVVTVVGVVDMAVSLSPAAANNSGATVFRAFRLMRIFRLARSWKSLNRTIKVLLSAMEAVGWLTVLLFLGLFIFALLGMALFGYKLTSCQVEGAQQLCPPGLTFQDCPSHFDCYVACDASLALQWFNVSGSPYGDMAYCEAFPRQQYADGNTTGVQYWAQVGKPDNMDNNYDQIWTAFLSAFIILTGDSYDQYMKQVMVLTNPWLGSLFTISFMVIGIFLLLNLFLAILLNSLDRFGEDSDNRSATGTEHGTRVYPTTEDDAPKLTPRSSVDCTVYDKAHGPEPEYLDSPLPSPRRALKPSCLRKPVPLESVDSLKYQRTLPPPASSATVPLPPSLLLPLPTLEVHANDNDPPSPVNRTSSGSKQPLFLELSGSGKLAEQPIWSKAHTGNKSLHGSFTPRLRTSATGAATEAAGPVADGDKPPGEVLHGRALFLLPPTSRSRQSLCKVVQHRFFEYAMLCLILLSSLALCFDDDSVEPGSIKRQVLYITDIIFVICFGIEACLKIMVFGFAFNGPDSYIRSPWNVLDFFVVVVCTLVLILEQFVSSNNIVWLRALRALRALRPLRAASKLKGIRAVIQAIILTIPAVGEVMLVASLFYYIMAVLGVTLLCGRLSYCADGNGNQLDPYYLVATGNINRSWCDSNGGQQLVNTSYYHAALSVPVPSWQLNTSWGANGLLTRFDNVMQALWVLMQVGSLENWSPVMWLSMQAAGVDEQPYKGANDWMSVYFLFFVVFCSFFILSLIIGVSIDRFNKLKRTRGVMLSRGQQDWLTLQRMMANTEPKAKYKLPANRTRAVCYHIVLSQAFDYFMVYTILTNVVVMFLTHQGMSARWESSLSIANAVYTGIFVMEMLLKWGAIGIKPYFQDGWSQFDFLVVVVSVLGVILDYCGGANLTIMPLLRVLRVLRIFKLIPKAKGLRAMMMTLLWSLPALVNVGSVLLMLMYVYAIVGMNLFGAVKLQQNLAYLANFQDFPTAMLLLFRMTTSENWNSVMWDCMVQTDCIRVKDTVNVSLPSTNTSTLLWAGTYLDPVADAATIDAVPSDALKNQCSPSPVVAALYFCTYMLLVVYLMVQLVIGIILENIELHSRMENMTVSQQHIQSFREVWEELDTHGDGMIHVTQLTTLLAAVDPPMGVKGLSNTAIRVQAIVQSLDIPLRNQHIHFLETLHALAGRVAGADLPGDEELAVHSKMVARLPKDDMPPKYSAGDFYAALYVRASIKGFLVRNQLKPLFDALDQQAGHRGEAELDAAGGAAARRSATHLTREERTQLLAAITRVSRCTNTTTILDSHDADMISEVSRTALDAESAATSMSNGPAGPGPRRWHPQLHRPHRTSLELLAAHSFHTAPSRAASVSLAHLLSIRATASRARLPPLSKLPSSSEGTGFSGSLHLQMSSKRLRLPPLQGQASQKLRAMQHASSSRMAAHSPLKSEASASAAPGEGPGGLSRLGSGPTRVHPAQLQDPLRE